MRKVYADTAAATPSDKRVLKAMLPFLSGSFGNPSSIHGPGVAAGRALAAARAKVAKLIGAHPDEIVFTSGGTEANNLAINGVNGAAKNNQNIKCRTPNNSIITASLEHASVLEPAKKLGAKIIKVGETGIVEAQEIKKALTLARHSGGPETKLVSVIYANNEIGTIQPIREIAKMIRNFRKSNPYTLTPIPYFHIDACQAPRFLDINVARLGVDLMTLNSGKIYGPKGVGCLFVRRGVRLDPLLLGGGQEAGRRSGTENVAGIVGFAEALSLCEKLKEKETKKLTILRDRLIRGLLKIEGVKLNGDPIRRLPNNVNVSFPILEPEQMVIELDALGIAASAGSACSSNKLNEAYDTIGVRFSLGRETMAADIDYIIKSVKIILNKYVRNSVTKI